MKMAVCGVKVGNTEIFSKCWIKSDHKHLNTITFIRYV